MLQQVVDLFAWSDWQPLNGSWLAANIPARPGLYRICRQGREDLDYVGQTGDGKMTLRNRLGMLRGIYDSVMPYRDPHTAGPALWALRQLGNQPFLVSVIPIADS